jgi:hypothetical protein
VKAEITRVAEGGRIELPYADVQALADEVEHTGGRALHAAGRAGALAVSPHLLVSLPFAPVTGTIAEGALVDLGIALTAWSGKSEVDAVNARLAAELLADVDDVAQVALHDLERVVAAGYGREHVAPHVEPTDLEVPSSATAPASLSSLVEHVSELSDLSDPDHPENNGTIEIQTITAADGTRRHIVYLPGLDDLGPGSVDSDVRDVGAAVALESGVPTAYGAGVVHAMHDHGISPGEDVMVVGHSQGGMQAAALAIQGTGFHVTQVVTAGAPVVPGHLPAGVQMLSLEHEGDPVPLFDAGAVDDSPGHITVTFDSGIDVNPQSNHSFAHYIAGAHAAEQSTDPVVHQAVGGVQPFLAHPGDHVESTIFQITRGDSIPLSPLSAALAVVAPGMR